MVIKEDKEGVIGMNKRKKKTKRRLKRIRMSVYTIISLAIIESSGVFSMASVGLLFIKSNSTTNAFNPKMYVDVTINEPNGNSYTLDDEGNVITNGEPDDDVGNGKAVYISNPGISDIKKSIVARAKLMAVIYDSSGQIYGNTMDYKISEGSIATNVTTSDAWYQEGEYYYYTSVIEPGEDSSYLFKNVKLNSTENIPVDGYVEFYVIIDTLGVNIDDTDSARAQNKTDIQDNWNIPSGIWENLFPNT